MGSDKPTILVVDDTPTNIDLLLNLLSREDYRVLVANDGQSGLEQAQYALPDLILLDVMMPGMDGFEACRRLKSIDATRDIPVVFMTALDEPQEKLRGFRAGASDYVTKPLDHQEVMARIDVQLELRRARREIVSLNESLEQRIVERTRELSAANAELRDALAEIEKLKNRLQAENTYLQTEIRDSFVHPEIVGRSRGLQEVLERVDRVAPTDAVVLISGETGTGKELVARLIHERSKRAAAPMVKLNCAAISAGLVESELFGHVKGAFTGATEKRVGRFELADNGTLFLDEVSELPLDTQVKLLRVLQEQEFEPVGSSTTVRVDVRVIAATNRELLAQVAAGKFRDDLFYRLNVFPIGLPPLRARREDIPELVHYFVDQVSRKLGKPVTSVEPQAMSWLVNHDWPGNIRDLRNTIERLAVLSEGGMLTLDDAMEHGAALPVLTQAPPAAPQRCDAKPDMPSLADVERTYIISVLRKTSGVIEGPRGAARLLNLKPSTARHRMRKLGISSRDFLHRGEPAVLEQDAEG